VIEENRNARSQLLVLCLGSIPFLVLAASHWGIGPLARFGDWAQYMMHADALRLGRHYGDIGYIFTSRNPFIGPPVQPPGLPAALVPLLVITDGARDSVVYKLFMVACSLAFLAVVAVYFGRDGKRAFAIATVLVTGLWLETGFATNAVQPDVAFSAFVWGIFCLADRPGPWSWRRITAITALGLAALSFRMAGLPLLPAVALYALVHRRDVGARAWVPVIAWGVCGLAVAALVPGTLTFARLVPRDASVLIRGVIESAKVYPFAILDLFLYPFPWNHVNDAYHVAIAALAVIGLVAWVRIAATRLLVLFALCYVGMLLVLPMQDGRYLMPLAPLAVYLSVLGISIVTRWAATQLNRKLSVVVPERVALGVVVAIAVGALGQELSRPRPAVLMDTPGVRPLFARLRAARDTMPVRVLFMNPRVLTWETGVPAMGFFQAEPDTTLAELRARRITHVVVGDIGTDERRARSVQSAVDARPGAFRRMYTEGVFTVYAFDSTPAAAAAAPNAR
jgi:hypothetical protein